MSYPAEFPQPTGWLFLQWKGRTGYCLRQTIKFQVQQCHIFHQRIIAFKWFKLYCVREHQTLHRHTCCGRLMLSQLSSSTCSKNPTTSHTTSSGNFFKFKVTLSTRLCTRLPVGACKWYAISASASLWQALHNTKLQRWSLLSINYDYLIPVPLHSMVWGCTLKSGAGHQLQQFAQNFNYDYNKVYIHYKC